MASRETSSGRVNDLPIADRGALIAFFDGLKALRDELKGRDVPGTKDDLIDRAVIDRIRSGKSNALSRENAGKIVVELGRARALAEDKTDKLGELFDRAMLGSSGDIIQTAYREFAERAVYAFLERPTPYWHVDEERRTYGLVNDDYFASEIVHDRPGVDLFRIIGFRGADGLAARRANDIGELLEFLKDTPIGGQLEQFLFEVRQDNGLNFREGLALVRIVGPLLESTDSCWVDRSWRDMVDDDGSPSPELATFIRAGIDRERALLPRPNTNTRIHELHHRATHPMFRDSHPQLTVESGGRATKRRRKGTGSTT